MSVDHFNPVLVEKLTVAFVSRKTPWLMSQVDDAVQEAHLRVWSKMGAFDPARGSFSTYASRIIATEVIDKVKRDAVAVQLPIRHTPTHKVSSVSLNEPTSSAQDDKSERIDMLSSDSEQVVNDADRVVDLKKINEYIARQLRARLSSQELDLALRVVFEFDLNDRVFLIGRAEGASEMSIRRVLRETHKLKQDNLLREWLNRSTSEREND